MNPITPDTIRAALRMATLQHKKEDLAAAFGCSRQTLYNFLSGGTLGNQFLEQGARWLSANGYTPLLAEDPAPYGPATSPELIIAEELELVAKKLRNPGFDGETKFRALLQLAADLEKARENLRKIFAQRHESP